jgi:hypothetical protein
MLGSTATLLLGASRTLGNVQGIAQALVNDGVLNRNAVEHEL